MTKAPQPPLGGSLDTSPPAFAADRIARLAARHWGLTGSLKPLTSERDQNHLLDGPSGRFVVKIANLAEGHDVQRMQNRALRHIAARDPGLPVPRVIATQDGADDLILPEGHLMRVLTWLDGQPLHAAPQGRAQTAALGAMLARLTRALEGFTDPAADHHLQWDIKNAAQLLALLPDITDPETRALCADVLDRFTRDIAPRLAELPWQVVHSDFNPHNILVAPDGPAHVVGILDFGDMVHTPRICDMAVGAAYRVWQDDPLAALTAFAAAYHRESPLSQAELSLYPDLVAARMVTTVAIASWRAARYPENAPYILRNLPSARDGLRGLAALDRRALGAALASACPMEDNP